MMPISKKVAAQDENFRQKYRKGYRTKITFRQTMEKSRRKLKYVRYVNRANALELGSAPI